MLQLTLQAVFRSIPFCDYHLKSLKTCVFVYLSDGIGNEHYPVVYLRNDPENYKKK